MLTSGRARFLQCQGSLQQRHLSGSIGIFLHAFKTGLRQCEENTEEKSQYCSPEYDQGALREGALVRRSGWVDDLNDRALFRLIKLGQLELASKYVKNGLEVFDVAQAPNIFRAGVCHLTFGDDDSSWVVPGPSQFG